MNSTYKHGVMWQDHQHEQLLDCISSLNKVRDTEEEKEEFIKLINFLELYVKTHFDLETYYMKSLGYPDKDDHVLEHDKFTSMVVRYKRKAEKSQHSSELLTELCNWIQNHILEKDAKLAEFIIERGKIL
ncbi:MAG: bacteriohemerythrin [Planctomycetota bacterium]